MIRKPRRSTKFDFSGTNYEVQTMGYLSGLEDEHREDPNLFTKICNKAKQASSAQKPAGEVVEDKFATIRSNPAFLARASLRTKILGRTIHKVTSGNCENGGNGEVYKMNGDTDEANCGEEPKEVMDDENAGYEASDDEDNDDMSGEDQDKGGEEQLATEYSEGKGDDSVEYSGDSEVFGCELTELEEEPEGDEVGYFLTEEGSQA